MKKKIIALALALALILVAGVGMTLAYFTDTETATNVFTMGNVDIALREDNGLDENDEDYKADEAYRNWLPDQLLEPSIELGKRVWIDNNGLNPAYVRVAVMIPADLVDMLDIKYADDLNDNWQLSTDKNGDTVPFFTETINGVEYTGYCYTYIGTDDDKLPAKASTSYLLESIMLYDDVTCEVKADGTTVYTYEYKDENGDDKVAAYTDVDGFSPVLVYAEAGQTTGNYGEGDARKAWENADEALNAMFDEPGVKAKGYFSDNVVYVTNPDALVDTLNSNKDVILTEDVDVNAADTNAYGKTALNVKAGQTIDGNGNTLSTNGWDKWDSAISTTGGTIQNLTIDSGMRGIFVNHNSSESSKVILKNVIIDGTVYTISCDQGTGKGLEATDCTFNGWTSYAATIGNVTFTNCYFGEGQGYSFCRPYAPTEFVGCEFEAGYEMDPRAAVTFENCTLGGVALTADNLATLVTSNIQNASVK